jgi:CTP-dependent riboflavin kinase
VRTREVGYIEIEYYLRKVEEKIKAKLRYHGTLLKNVKVKEEKPRRNIKPKGGGATDMRIDFLV